MNLPLDCQSLPHYSEFETNSESGYTDFSIGDVKASAFTNNNLTKIFNGNKKIKGSRPLRRFRNDACVHSLYMLLEIDPDEEPDHPWPETIGYPTYLSNLFTDPLLMKAWNNFMCLPEKEQLEQLTAMRRSQINSEKKSVHKAKKNRLKQSLDEVSIESFVITGDSISDISVGDSFDLCEDFKQDKVKQNSKISSEKGPFGLTLAECQRVYQDPSTAYTRFSSRKRNRKAKSKSLRALTALDLYLLDKAEHELREMFKTRDLERCKNNWIPSYSLLESAYSSFSNEKALWLDNYQRKLLHMLASYLGLHSESIFNDDLMDKQISIKCSWSSKEFQMPDRSFIIGIGECNLNSIISNSEFYY